MYLFELSDNFGGQIKLPYSTGLIWSYCLQNKTIKDNYDLKGWFYKRESAENILKKIDNPDDPEEQDLYVYLWIFCKQFEKRVMKYLHKILDNIIKNDQ